MPDYTKGGIIPPATPAPAPKTGLFATRVQTPVRTGVSTNANVTRSIASTFNPSTPAVPTAPGSVAQPSRIPEGVRQYGFPAGGAALAAGGAFLAGLAMPIIATGAILGALGGHLLSKKV